jgi:hypothetical protein
VQKKGKIGMVWWKRNSLKPVDITEIKKKCEIRRSTYIAIETELHVSPFIAVDLPYPKFVLRFSLQIKLNTSLAQLAILRV